MGPWLLLLAAPLVKRVLAALGVGIITYAGYTVFLDTVKAAIISNWSGMAGPAFEIASMIGFPQAFGIILGALSARLTIQQVKRFGIL